MTADELLEAIASLHSRTRSSYRDQIIRVGEMICEYLVMKLKEGDGLNEHHRRQKRLLRSYIVNDVAHRLGVTQIKINEYIRIAWVKKLLLPNGCGNLSYSSIRTMRALIHRANRGKQVQRTKKARKGEISVSDLEVWEPRGEKSLDIAAAAVTNGWTDKRLRQEILAIPHMRGAYHKSLKNRAKRYLPRPACKISIVDQIVNLLLSVDDPDQILSKVKNELVFAPVARQMRDTIESEHESRLKAYEKAAQSKKPLFQETSK